MQVAQVVFVSLWVALAGWICYRKVSKDFSQYPQNNTEGGEQQ